MSQMLKDEGILLVVSGPSGAGKGTICSAVRKLYPALEYSISMTTRAPRNGETEGVSYFSAPMKNSAGLSRKMHFWNTPAFTITITERRSSMCSIRSGKDARSSWKSTFRARCR